MLTRARVDLSRLKIVFFELNPYNRDVGLFIPMLDEALESTDLPAHIKQVTTLALASELQEEDLFIIDDHITAAGHRRIAKRLAEIIVEYVAQ